MAKGMKDNGKTKGALIRQKAEEQLKLNADKSPNLFKTEADRLKLIHEPQVHQIELEMQMEELNLAKQQEELAKEKYTNIFDHAPSAYFTLTASGNITDINLSGAKMLGKDRSILIDTIFSHFISIDSRDSFADFLSKVLNGKSPQNCEVHFCTKEGILLYSHLSGSIADDGIHCLITAIDITDRKNIELALRKEVERNSLLLGLFTDAPDLNDKELYDRALDIAVKITDSKIGFFHKVSDNQQEAILTTWNDEAKKNCTAVYDNHYPIELAGNWADCLRQKKAVIYNDYPASPNKKGMPEGHAIVSRTMMIPVIHEEKARLIFGVGNKSSDYTDLDVLHMQAVANELYKILGKRKLEEDLQKTKERLHFAIEGSNDGIWDWNIITGEVFFSNRWKEMIGHESEELDGKLSEWQNRVHPDDIDEVLLKLQQHFNRETPQYIAEHRIKCKDGSWKWIADRGKVLQWTAEGKPARMVGTHADISSRKHTEDKLKESEFQYRNLADSGSALIWTSGTDKLCNYFNSPWLKFTGRTLEQEMGNGWAEGVHPDDFDNCLETYISAFNKQFPFEMEYRLRHASGEYRWILDLGTPNFNSKGEFVGYIGHCFDISERKKMDIELRIALSKYKTLFDVLPIGIAVSDKEGRLMEGNLMSEKLLGLSNEEVIRRQINGAEWQVVRPDGTPMPADEFASVRALKENRKIENVELGIKKSPNETTWLIVSAAPIPIDGQGVVITYTDVTDHKLIEDTQSFLLSCGLPGSGEKFFESLARYLAETLNMEYVCIDRLEPDGLTAQTVAIYNEGQFESNVQYALKDTPCGEVVDKRICCYRNGVRHLFPNDLALQDLNAESYVGTTLIDSKGQAIGLIAIIGHRPLQDERKAEALLKLIAQRAAGELERRQAENALNETLKQLLEAKVKAEESESRLRNYFQLGLLGMAITSIDKQWLEINDTVSNLLGYSKEELSQKTWAELTHHDDIEIDFSYFDQVMKGEIDGYKLDKRFIRKNGEIIYTELAVHCHRDENKKVKYFLALINDITDRKITEQQLVIAKERAEESDRLKSAFLANMSHEIRTPMNGILGFSELLKTPGLTGDEQQKYIRIIEKSGTRMLNIINDIIDISKIEAGLIKLELKETNINEQIEFIYTFFKPEVETKGMKLSFNNHLTAKEATIKTDTEKLYAILSNLVKNAIKYTKEGAIEFGYLKKDENLEFYVKDTGIGIQKDRQSAIFERFIQADIEDRDARQGAGLGLSITKSYVEMCGGKIWVESEEGLGSTFYFAIPYITEPAEIIVFQEVLPFEKGNNKLSNLRILIAEDDEVSAVLLELEFKAISKEILKAGTGSEAVEICRNNPNIDLILMDSRMPEMSGYEATRQIRTFNKNIIIIAQTAYAMAGDREKALQAGCNDYITKPLNHSLLLKLIQKYFK